MKNGLISIIIPCYNGEEYLDRCFNALLNQTYNNMEIIIVDDGSIDKTAKIIEKYALIFKNKNIDLKNIKQKNMGQAAAVNNALKLVEGEFLVWQDCDDYYEYDALQNMKKYLDNNKDMDFVRGESFSRDNKNLEKIIYYGKSKYPRITKIFDFFVFETDSYMYPGVFMVRMKFFDKCIKNREIYISRAGQNWQLILPLAYYGNCGYLNKVVYNYVVIDDSHSHSLKKTKDLFKRCNEHKDILFHVLDTLQMPKVVLKKYKTKIKIKYIKKKVRIVLSKIKEIILKRKK